MEEIRRLELLKEKNKNWMSGCNGRGRGDGVDSRDEIVVSEYFVICIYVECAPVSVCAYHTNGAERKQFVLF